MITFDNVSKSFGSRVLFDEVTINVGKGEKIGLVGKNGHGKTTLLRIIMGVESYDSGKFSIPKNYKIGYLKQKIAFEKSTVIDEAMTAIISDEPESERWKAEKILFGLGFSKDDMEKDPLSFSGGFQVRLCLTQTLLSEPDMLLLDEPTNYLDIVSVRWLKNFLKSWKGELMLITHDRMFMDDVITHTIGIHRGKMRKIAGRTEKYYERIAKDEEIYEKTRVNDEQKRKEMETYITRFRAKARLAGLVQSRIKALNKMEKKDKLAEIRTLEFAFRYKHFAAKQIMHCTDITFGYNKSHPLIKDFSIIIGSNDRIGVIGKNGRGKSTLMKVMAGILKPDKGSITAHNGSSVGYFEQTNTSTLTPSNTVEEEIQSVSENFDRSYVRNICGAMMFPQDEALKKISVLSGGEKSRVMLGKIIAQPLNLIMLDEPTNHLDMDSAEALMEALDEFDGALVMITHNELLLHGLATRLIVFQGDYPYIFDGTYSEFLEKVGWSDEFDGKKGGDKQKVNKKDARKSRSDSNAERSKAVKPLEEKIVLLENAIHEAEVEMKQVNEQILDAAQKGEGKKIAELSPMVKKFEEDINKYFAELESTENTLSETNAKYDEKIEE